MGALQMGCKSPYSCAIWHWTGIVPYGSHGGAQVRLRAYAQVATADTLEQILSRENMLKAWKRVKANKGKPGMDDMSIEEFSEFARQHWERIRSALEQGTYRPAAVLRVMIPKATGGQRPLGIHWLWNQGVPNMRQQWVDLHYPAPPGAA